MPDLSTQEGREALTKIIGSADVVIIDNLSAWDRSGREDADSWSRLTGWMQDLTRAGVAVIVVHHAGKSGDQRGTSRREDMMDTVIKLVPSKGTDHGGLQFDLHFTKAKHVAGRAIASRTVRLGKDEEGRYFLDMQIHKRPTDWQDTATKLHAEGKSDAEIGKLVGKNRSTVYRLFKK